MRLPITQLCLLTFLWPAAPTNRQNEEAGRVIGISLDFPHGELRLMVRRDDGTRLFYGALPQSQLVRPATFDIDSLFAELGSRLNPLGPIDDSADRRPYGMVQLSFGDGRDEQYLLHDREYAEVLLRTGCQNILYDPSAAGEIFGMECASVGVTIPPN